MKCVEVKNIYSKTHTKFKHNRHYISWLTRSDSFTAG